MIKVKNVFEAVELDDGGRLWVESIGLTKDLREWCAVSAVLTAVGPPQKLANWFENHPEGYDEFRARYHEELANSRILPQLKELAKAARKENFTLLHHGDHPSENTASALHDFISELQAYAQSDQ